MFRPKLLLLSLIFLVVNLTQSSAQSVAVDCHLTNSLETLVECLEAYTVPSDYYSCTTYDTAQPHGDELAGWTAAVTRLLNADGTCALPAGSPISTSYAVSRFVDGLTHDPYCVLAETNAVPLAGKHDVFQRGWGYFIAPAVAAPGVRPLHFSVPHPLFDSGTPVQAAAVLKRVVGKSLLIEGRHRWALGKLAASPTCNTIACAGPAYNKTDGAHDTNEPFHQALVAIHSWQQARTGGCPNASCGYIQWHGKGDETCPSDNVFLSSGIAASSCYADITLPVNRIKAQLNGAFPGRTHVTPRDDPSCTDLTATRNIFGRLVNGVSSANVCTTGASSSICSMPGTTFGSFVHIEQDSISRDPTNYNRWSSVISLSF